MIKVNKDQKPEISRKYNIDGEYVPRVFAMMPDGRIMEDIYPPAVHKYAAFNSSREIIGFMGKAKVRRLRR